MLVARAEPGELIEQPDAVRRLSSVERLIAAKRQVLQAVCTVFKT